MKKVFIGLWIVVALFAAGFVGIVVASFTTETTTFSGEADLHLRFASTQAQPISIRIFDSEGHEVPQNADGTFLLHPKFETRETNVFDKFLGGPRPRTAVVAFADGEHHRHEMTFTYDRHDRAWNGEISFPDSSLSQLEIEKSSLEFKGLDGKNRRYSSTIFAKALQGPPVIDND